MNIAVCDDEENIRCLIGKLIRKQEGSFHIMEFSSGRALLQFWQQEGRERIDILFLDISMNDIDGMEVAKQIRAEGRTGRTCVGQPSFADLCLGLFGIYAEGFFRQCFSVFAETDRREGI